MAIAEKILTVFERAGEEAAEEARKLVDRHPEIFVDEVQIEKLIEAERQHGIEMREERRRKGHDNNLKSVAPGLKAILTEDGHDMALETAGEIGFSIEEFSVVSDGLAIVTLDKGIYKIDSGSAYFYECSRPDDHGLGLLKPVESAGSFHVATPGVAVIEGLTAQERWLNSTFNPDGTPL